MSNKHIDNIGLLQKFVLDNDLRDNHSNIIFNCEFNIKTPKSTQIEECEARITFNGFDRDEGQLILNSNLPSSKYPTTFKAYYNEFSIENDILVVRDTHPTIGLYEAKITSLGKCL